MNGNIIFLCGLIHLLEHEFRRPDGAKDLRALRSALLKANEQPLKAKGEAK